MLRVHVFLLYWCEDRRIRGEDIKTMVALISMSGAMRRLPWHEKPTDQSSTLFCTTKKKCIPSEFLFWQTGTTMCVLFYLSYTVQLGLYVENNSLQFEFFYITIARIPAMWYSQVCNHIVEPSSILIY